MRFVSASLICFASIALSVGPAKALDWNFSFQYDNGESASGTFTTNGVAVVVGQVYTISSISGTHAGHAITGLSGAGGSNQDFEWTGSTFYADSSGIGYAYSTYEFNIYHAGPPYGSIDLWGRFSAGNLDNTGAVSSSSGSSVSSSSSSVPGPLPLFGAAAAFGWSRRLRHRLNVSMPMD
jgi:MYXO-CTERM domain-containing protein